MTDRQREVARQLAGGAIYEHLRETGMAQDGDLSRLVDEGIVTTSFSGRCNLTEKGDDLVYPPTRQPDHNPEW